MLLLVAATTSVVHYGYQELNLLPKHSLSTSRLSGDHVTPTDNSWGFDSTSSSDHSVITKQPNQNPPKHNEKPEGSVGLLQDANEMSKIMDSIFQPSMKPNEAALHVSSEERKAEKIVISSKQPLEHQLPNSNNANKDPLFQQTSSKRLSILYEESKDIFELLPQAFLPDYKSFCWYDSKDEFQCLASVYLAGMPKCGTTDLFDKLMWHPELTTQAHHPDGGSEKERFYWTRRRVGRPISWLARPRVPPPKEPFSEFLLRTGAMKVKNNKELRIVDGTPALLWDLEGWETRYPGLEEAPYSNADLIHAVTPDAKILAILRNPVDRLYSEYLYFWKGGKMRAEVRSPQTFHLDVLRESRKFNQCLESKSLKYCCYSSYHSLRLRIALGVYICYIRDFLEVFGENLLVLTMNEYHSHTTETLVNIFNHIGVSKPNLVDLRNFIVTSKTINTNSDLKESIGEMLDETRDLLKEFYDPYNSELAALLGDSKYLFV